MVILEIRKYPSLILKEKCKLVEKVGEAERKLLNDMAETMYRAGGVGLAASQVGVNKQLIVVDAGEGLIKLINPKILKMEGREVLEEGCLSLPEITVEVKRARKVVIEGLNEEGSKVTITTEGLLARVFQHEIDHLGGILIIDHTGLKDKLLLRSKLRKAKKAGIEGRDWFR